jgi:hypothetical protein
MVALLAPVVAAAQDEATEAGDTTEHGLDVGPLKDRVVPVSGHLFLRKGRFELSPSATVSIRDAFFTKYILGGTLTYHIAETWAVSLRGGYSIPIVSGAAQICSLCSSGPVHCCRPPDGPVRRPSGEWRSGQRAANHSGR